MFHIPDKVIGWLGPTVVFVVGMFAIVGNPIGQDLFCKGTQNCFVTWVGALSGWAAAAAAGATIGSLVQQAKAAQKQADFQLGDAEPSLDAVQHIDRRGEVVLRIQNWNRRSMIIRRVKIITKSPVSLLYVDHGVKQRKGVSDKSQSSWSFSFAPAHQFQPALILEGWVNREREPPLVKISLSAYSGHEPIEIADEWKNIPIEIAYEMVGIQKAARLRSHVHLASTAIFDEDELETEIGTADVTHI